MRLVYLLATTGGWGGLEKHAFDVAGAMAERGHDVVILADPGYQERCPAGVRLQPFNWSSSRHNPLLWLRLRNALAALKPDIVHAQADKACKILVRSGWPAASAATGTVHNLKSDYGAYRKMDAVIAVSRALAEAVNHPRVHVVHNGIQVTAPAPQVQAEIGEWRVGKPSPLALAIGRLVPAKGFDLLLHAWPAETGATLAILGGGKQRQELEAIIAERGLRHVHLLGESSQVPEWISCADLLVISSRNEGGPYVLAEALTAGLPVISTEVGMVPDFLPRSCIVPPGDVAALNSLLCAAIANPDRYRSECEPAMAAARQQLTREAMMDGIEQAYYSTLAVSASAPDHRKEKTAP